MSKITYSNKVTLNPQTSIADINKVTADDMNEIKTVVNTNDDNTTANSTAITNLGNYSTTEVNTGKKWFDGKDIYRKVFQYTSASNTSWTLLDDNSYDYIIDVNGEVFSTEHYIGITKYLNFYRLNCKLYYQNASSFSQGKQVTFWIEYTKTS